MKKLVIAYLGGTAVIEQHNLFIGIGASFRDPKLITEMQKFWGIGTHIDDAVVLSEINGYDIKVVPIGERKESELKLYVVWIGWYEKPLQLPTPGVYILSTERHALFSIVAKGESDMKEKLLTYRPFAEGQSAAIGKRSRSHIDDKYGITFSDIDKIINTNSEVEKRGFALEITRQPEATSLNNEEWHGYGKFTKFLERKI